MAVVDQHGVRIGPDRAVGMAIGRLLICSEGLTSTMDGTLFKKGIELVKTHNCLQILHTRRRISFCTMSMAEDRPESPDFASRLMA